MASRLRNRTFIGLTLVALVIALPAFAGTISSSIIDVNSDTTGMESNNVSGADVIISDPALSWAPSGTNADGSAYDWVSYADTGRNNCLTGNNNPAPCPANTTTDGTPTAIFTKSFVLPNAFNSGFINIWADDSATVLLDGVQLIAANPTLGPNCANGPIGCITSAEFTIDISALDLAAGSHTLTLDAYQLGGGEFGVMYGGEITSSTAPGVPEPATYSLLGLGLVGMTLVAQRLKKRG